MPDNLTAALAQFAADLHEANRNFKPTSPLKDLGRSQDVMSTGAATDYRLDLALQNLLAIGAEFAPDDIISLRKRARYGDPRWLYSLYDEMMRLGPAPQVLKAREAIKATNTVWHATPDEADEDENADDPENKTARLIRDVTEEAWDKWLPDLKTHLSTKYFYGIAAVQVMWKPKAIEGRWSRVTDIRPIPARRFRLDPQTLRFKFLANPFSWEGPFVDDLQKTGKLIFVEVGADVEPLDQRGLLFQCLIPWAIEQFTVRWRAKRLQNFGMPPVMVKYPKGDPANKAVADLLADMLANGTRASLPSDMSAELLSAPGSGSRGGDPYESAIEWCARQYDQTILGHSQVSGVQVGAGSKSSGKDAIGLFKDVTNSRAKETDYDLEQQAWNPYVVREFGQEWADNHTPQTTSAVVERDDPAELSAVALNLFSAGAAGAIAVEDLVERCTLKVPEDGELTLAGNVKGEQPSPAEIGALGKAQPPALGEQAQYETDSEGKTVQKIKKAPPPQMLPGAVPPPGAAKGVGADVQQPASPSALAATMQGKPGTPGAKAANAPKQSAGFSTLADFSTPAKVALRKRKGRKAVMEFYTRRQRFAAASVAGRPAITLLVLNEPDPSVDATLDARNLSMSHPMALGVLDQMTRQVRRVLSAAAITGETEVTFGVLNDAGLLERLKEGVFANHAVNVERMAVVIDSEQRFYSEDQPRDEKGRFAGAGAESAHGAAEHRAAAAHHDAESKRAYAKGDNARGNAHYLAAGAHKTAAQFKKPVGEQYRKQRDYARGLSKQAHKGEFGPHGTYAAEPGELFATGIEIVKPRAVGESQAKIAARVRNRLKAQHAIAAAEAMHKLAGAE